MFSIIIPVYNAFEFIQNCIQSVVSQSFTDYELLLIDDGSTDGSEKLCDKWAEIDKRIRVFHQPNAGAGSARNTGIISSSGDYLLFLDADDWWKDTNVLSELAKRIEKCGADITSFNFQKDYQGILEAPYFSAATAPEKATQQEAFDYVIDHDLWISSPCNKAIRSKIIKENEIFFHEGITSEDIDWCLRLALQAEQLDYLNLVFFVYRQHSTSTSHQISVEATQRLLQNIQECLSLLQKSSVQQEKVNKLYSYVSYQYGTLLYSIAGLQKAEQRASFIKNAAYLKYLLSYSHNAKIRLLYVVCRLFGLRATILALQMKRIVKL